MLCQITSFSQSTAPVHLLTFCWQIHLISMLNPTSSETDSRTWKYFIKNRLYSKEGELSTVRVITGIIHWNLTSMGSKSWLKKWVKDRKYREICQKFVLNNFVFKMGYKSQSVHPNTWLSASFVLPKKFCISLESWLLWT